MEKKTLSILVILSCLSIAQIFAQGRSDYYAKAKRLRAVEYSDYIYLGASVGGSLYSGHYANQSFGNLSLSGIAPSVSLMAQKRFTANGHLRLMGGYTNLRAKQKEVDADAFNTNVLEGAALVVYDFRKKSQRNYYPRQPKKNWQYYAMAGLGLNLINSTQYLEDNPDKKSFEGAALIGLGTRHHLSAQWAISIEALGRVITSNSIIDGNASQALPLDMYGTLTFSVLYRIPGKRNL